MVLFPFVVVAFVFVVCLVGWFLPEHCGHHAGLHYRWLLHQLDFQVGEGARASYRTVISDSSFKSRV